VIHLVGPAVLAAALAGIGVYGLLARRNAVLVLVGAELLLASAGVLLVTASTLPAGGLAQLSAATDLGTTGASTAGASTAGAITADAAGSLPAPDQLLPGQVLTVFAITIGAAEIGLALAVVLLLFRARATSDVTGVRELGEASPTYSETPG
jgi:NADH-quinone oxidoreductase subunit K